MVAMIEKGEIGVDHEAAFKREFELVHVQRASIVLPRMDGLQAEGEDTQRRWMKNVQNHINELYAFTASASVQNDFTTPNQQNNEIQQHQQHPIFAPVHSTPRIYQHGQNLNDHGRPALVHSSSSTPTSAFFSIPRSLLPIADQLFPSDCILAGVPSYALPLPSSSPSLGNDTAHADKLLTVKDDDKSRWVKSLLSNIKYQPIVDAIISDIDPEQLQRDVRHLTNEDGDSQGWRTRHSFTDGAREAAKWIKGELLLLRENQFRSLAVGRGLSLIGEWEYGIV